MVRKYYKYRVSESKISVNGLFDSFMHTYMYFKEKDFFKEKLSITYSSVSKEAKYLSSISLKHQIFPIENWD
ncbi:MAG: hypothetical protein ABJ356_06710, partial [Balneola sp.]